MAFRFSLATVLRLREIAEDREERMLGQIVQQRAQSRQSLADLAEQRANLITQCERALQQKTSAAELLFFHGQIRVLEELQAIGTTHLANLDALHKQQLKIYEAAHCNQKLLATMREEHLEHFRAEQARGEQNRMDDRFSARRALRP